MSNPINIRPIKVAAGVATAMALLALPFAVATTQHEQIVATYRGYDLLWLGLLGPLTGEFAWFANPAGLFACLAMLRGWWLPRWMNVAMFILLALFALDALIWNDVPTDADASPIVAHHMGFYLWLASVVVADAGLALLLLSGARAGRSRDAGAASVTSGGS